MADTFEDLGIVEPLAEGAESLGWETPSGIQKDAVPVIRRGNNVVLHASAGSGVVGAYALGLLDRVVVEEVDATPAILVLVPDAAAASRAARTIAALADPAGLTVRALSPDWPDRFTSVLVAPAASAVAAIRDSALKLDGLIAVVVDGADRLIGAGAWEDVETVLEAVPSGAQRVVATGGLPDRIQSFLERHVRRAMTVPPRGTGEGAEEEIATIRYAVASEHDKIRAALALLPGVESGEIAVVVRTHDRAESVARDLAHRGLPVAGLSTGEAEGEGRRILVLPLVEADQRSTRAEVLSLDVPFDAAGLTALHRHGGAVVATPGELPHLRRIAARAGIRLDAAPTPPAAALVAVERTRQALRDTLRAGDLAAELALIEPLLVDHSAAEVAAAALALSRSRAGESGAAAGGHGSATAAGAPAAPTPGPGAGAPPPETVWTRLFLTVGERDGVGPGDIVGAITGEAGVEGDQVGKIEIRETHSTVEVAATFAERVISALNGRTLRGRSLRVDYDRKDRHGQGRGPGGRKGGPPPKGRGPGRRGPARGAGGRGGAGRGPRRG